MAVPGDLHQHLLAAADRLRHGGRAEDRRDGVRARRTVPLTNVAREQGVLERMLLRFGHELEATGGAMGPGQEPPALRQAAVVTRGLEHRHRLGDRLRGLLLPALRPASTQADEQADERRVSPYSVRTRTLGLLDRLVQHGLGVREAAHLEERLAEVGKQLQPRSLVLASSATARPRRFAAAGTSPRAKALRPADASRRAPSAPSARPWSSSGPSSERYRYACSR